MIRFYAQLFLLFFGISISFYPLMETGHEILHQFKNSLHHHEVATTDHHHTIADHHVGGDHKLQMAEEEREGFNYIALMLGFSCPSSIETPINSEAKQNHSKIFVCLFKSITQLPATPPPWFRRML